MAKTVVGAVLLLVLAYCCLLARAFVPAAAPAAASRAAGVQQQRRRFSPAALEAVKDAKSPEEFDKMVAEAGEKLLIVDYSTTWCGPCKMMAPKFDDMSNRFTNAVFIKVVGDSTPEAGQLLKREGVRSVPAFHFWKNGKRVDSISGADPERLEEVIMQNI